jgi:formylglycine-generating enzyme required for sulfatase activity
MTRLRTAAGRADLIRAFAAGGEKGLAAAAALLGYREEEEKRAPASSPLPVTPAAAPPVEFRQEALNFAPIPFLRVVSIEYYDEQELPAPLPVRALDLDPPRSKGQPAPEPLVEWPRLWRVLEDTIREPKRSKHLDVPRLVADLASGRAVRRLPRRLTPAAGRIHLLLDRSRRLAPFWHDQLVLAFELRRRLGPSLRLGIVPAGGPESIETTPGLLLVVSDLGLLGEAATVGAWEGAGRRLVREGVKLRALVPCPRDRWRPSSAELWNAIEWENPAFAAAPGSARSKEELEKRRDKVLRLLRPAIRIEPGLLREVRRLPGVAADAGTEADVWATFPNPSSVAATPSADPGGPPGDPENEDLLRAAWSAIRCWHEELPPLVLAEETALPKGSAAAPAELEKAREYLRSALARVRDEGIAEAPFLVEWFRELSDRLPGGGADPELAGDIAATWSALYSADPSLPLPAWVSPALLATLEKGKEPRQYSIFQIGSRIELRQDGKGSSLGSPLGQIRASGSRIALVGVAERPVEISLEPPLPAVELENLPPRLRLVSNLEAVELAGETRPSWASAAGRDRYGLWADLEIEGVVQRMRYIRPGRFIMGSPESEQGRYDDEGPQHLVTLTEGFWLADTPCTQEFWQTLIPKNPSRFQSPRRPVEQVSWEDAHGFLRALESRLGEGFEARLPTEAQWEYACRAGTTTSTYAGELEILGACNGPLLHEIAWYGGNSGVDYDLEEGADSSGWPEKQFEHRKAGSREVARKAPNAWGLYDTLGNVWEWCADYWNDRYEPGEQRDPTGLKDGPHRVIRGGSWVHAARSVRAAARHWSAPGDRSDYLGFRFSLGRPRSGKGRGAR